MSELQDRALKKCKFHLEKQNKLCERKPFETSSLFFRDQKKLQWIFCDKKNKFCKWMHYELDLRK